MLQSILSRSSGLQHAVLQKSIQSIESTKTYIQWQSSFTHKQLDVIFDVLKSSCKALVPAVSSESNAYQTWVFESDWDEHVPWQTRLRIWQTYQSCWFSQPRFVHFVGVGRHWLSLSFWSHLASTCINHSESTNQSQWWNPNPSSSTMIGIMKTIWNAILLYESYVFHMSHMSISHLFCFPALYPCRFSRMRCLHDLAEWHVPAATEPFLTMSAVVPWLPVESVMAVLEKMKTDWTARPWPDSIHLRCHKTPQPQVNVMPPCKQLGNSTLGMEMCHVVLTV